MVAGALAPLALAPANLLPLAILSVALFWYSLKRAVHTSQAIFIGLAYGLGYFGVGVSWVFVSMVDHSQTHWFVAGLLTFLFCGGLALFYALLAALFHHFKPQHRHPALLFIGLWVCLDLLRAWLLTGFPWLYLGYGGLGSYVAYYAPLLGVHGVTFLVVASGLLLIGPRVNLKLRLVLMAGIWLTGYVLSYVSWTQESPQKPIKVTLLQANVALDKKWLPEQLTPTLNYYLKQTYRHLDSDLVVWPETAVATYWDYIKPAFESLTKTAQEQNTQIITGTVIRDGSHYDADYYNALVSFGAGSASTQGEYKKQRLVPFVWRIHSSRTTTKGGNRFFQLTYVGF